ncbi:MAG TPA: guanosine monophosphate reductase [Erysipelothrix sp.]|jgi:IMP dehydrogenase|nr:guanosine monophosphate reductase [Erysipelothrix sp.]
MDTLNGKILKEGYTFDDVLLVPDYSEVVPNNVEVHTQLTQKIKLNIPLLSAAMDTVTEDKMAIAMANEGGLGVIHKNMPIEDQARMVRAVKETEPSSDKAAVDGLHRLICGAAVGVGPETLKRVSALVEAEVDIIVVDSAHGHSKGILDTVRSIRSEFKEIDIMAGNIISASAATDLIYAGATCVKVGVGPGSICTTRVVSGVGVPQLTAISDVYQIAKQYKVGIVADGGIKQSGDIVKALAAGADCVMLGGLFAGTEETPGKIMEVYGKKVKSYVGMGSLSAMQRGSSDRYFQGGVAELDKLVPEGIEATVPYKGPVKDTCYQMIGGLRSGMGYCGCKDIEELKIKSKFIVISGNGLRESHPHDVTIVKEAPNYRV